MQLLRQEPWRRAGPSEDGKIRAVHDLRASDGESALGGKMFARRIPQRRFAGLFRMHGTHILQTLYLVPEYMQAICCRKRFFPSEAPSGNASGRNLATARRG